MNRRNVRGRYLCDGYIYTHETWCKRVQGTFLRAETACGRAVETGIGKKRRRGLGRKAGTSENVREKFQYASKFWRPCMECIWAPWLCFGSIFFSYFRYCTGEFPRFITACAIESPLSSIRARCAMCVHKGHATLPPFVPISRAVFAFRLFIMTKCKIFIYFI